MIEHIAPWLALELAKECYAILELDGVLILEQPNIKYAAAMLLGYIERPHEEFEGQHDMAAFYGDPSTKNELMLHRWGYHPESMAKMLVEAGFDPRKFTIRPTQFHGSRDRDFRIEARK